MAAPSEHPSRPTIAASPNLSVGTDNQNYMANLARNVADGTPQSQVLNALVTAISKSGSGSQIGGLKSVKLENSVNSGQSATQSISQKISQSFSRISQHNGSDIINQISLQNPYMSSYFPSKKP